ncbi:MAG: hypothetical protein JNL08_11940 [Planctomycetes bacterium]|nr:hypothetical protein [Planctomycetota bacterium]
MRGRTTSGLALLALFLVLLATWGNVETIGASLPDDPVTLRTTTTWSVFGRWPFVVVDGGSVDLRWPGLVLGLALSAAAVALTCVWLRPRAAEARVA